MPKWINNYKFNDEDFIAAIKSSISIREAILKMGLVATGSAFRVFKKRASVLNIDTSHLLGKSHMIGKTNPWVPKRDLDEIMVEDSDYITTSRLKSRLLKLNLLTEECYECHMTPLWNGKKLVLQLDHINGVCNDHRLENLRLLCPNCHSQTDTFAGKNVGGTRET